MKKIFLLLLSSLVVLAGNLPVWADGLPIKAASEIANVVKGGTLAVQASSSSGLGALNAIEAMRIALAGTETRASGLAQIPTSPAMRKRFETDRNTALKFGWAAQVQGDGLTMLHARERLHTAELLPSKTAHSLLKNPDNIERLPQEQREYVMLANYPAVAVEGSAVLGKVQVERALALYQQIIETTPNISIGEEAFKNWGKLMSAVTNIGFFSTAESADLIITAAKKVQSGILTGPTDVIAVWALLNLKAYGEIQTLADIRLNAVDGNGTPMMLPYEWGEIQKYMQANHLDLVIPQGRIAPVAEKSTLSRIPMAEGWLGYYNPYNPFTANPSAENTANFMQLRKAMVEKAMTIQVKQSVTEAIPSLTPKTGTTIVLATLVTPEPNVKAFTPQMSREAAEQAALEKYTPEQLTEIAQQQDRLFRLIRNGHVQALYNVSGGRVFSPYQQSLARAQVSGNKKMENLLKQVKSVKNLNDLVWDANTVSAIQEYMEETTCMVFLGYSWGEQPLQEVMIPERYHSKKFNTGLSDFLLNHPEFSK